MVDERKNNMAMLLGKVQNKAENSQKRIIDINVDLIRSVAQNGVQQPIKIREKENGRFEVYSGHRRLYASKENGLKTIPSTIENISNEAAAIMMVDSNMTQRQSLLPSEKSFAYKIKLEAMKELRKGGHSVHPSEKGKSIDLLADEMGENAKQIQRYIRLTELIPSLLEKVDTAELAFIPAVDISYLTKEQQGFVEDVINIGKVKPTKVQAAELKVRAQEKI